MMASIRLQIKSRDKIIIIITLTASELLVLLCTSQESLEQSSVYLLPVHRYLTFRSIYINR